MIEMLLLGLVGSTHCLGMCGGFVLALGRRAPVYQLGRLLGYSLVGAAVASAGWAARLSLGNRMFLVVAALAMLALAAGFSPGRPGMYGWLLRLPILKRPFYLGLLTAVLPCGLLGAAWMLAATTGHPLLGAAWMAAFWLGTLPALLLAQSLRPLAVRYPKAGFWLITAMAIMMLWRALQGDPRCH